MYGAPYREFGLADLQGGLIAILPDSGVSTLAFDIQAVDDTGNLSDSDPVDARPASVSIRVVARKEIDAGKEMPVNDDRRATSGDGALTPGDAALDDWIDAATGSRLSVLVRLEGGKRGDALFLEDGHDIATIASSWRWDDSTRIGTLSLRSNGSATVGDFQAVLNVLALRTVRFAGASARTISVRRDIATEVLKKDYYMRDILVSESGPRPYVGVQRMGVPLRFGKDDRAFLLSSAIFMEDFDSSASDVTIVMHDLTSPATLQRNDGDGNYTSITPEDDDSYAFTLDELQQGLIAIFLTNPRGRNITFGLKAKDSSGNWNDVGKSNTYERGVQSFSLYAFQDLSSQELEVDVQTGYQKAVPFAGLTTLIEAVRLKTSRDGVLHVVLENGVSGDRLVMRKSVSDIAGTWSDAGHRYALTVSDGATTSAQIDQALAQIYYRASESAWEKERELVVRWVDSASTETLLLRIPLANRPPVLRQWGIAARYHDITPARGASETPLDLGYHPYREYMPEVLDNEGEVVRLEVVLVNKADGVLSPDERVFLSRELQGRLRTSGLVLRELHSSDRKSRALVIEAADGKTPISPAFMSRILQGLSYRHGAAGRDGDVGERREFRSRSSMARRTRRRLRWKCVWWTRLPIRPDTSTPSSVRQSKSGWACLKARGIPTTKPA